MNMEKMQRYVTARSLAGHDQNTQYVVCDYDSEYVYLTDGRLKPLDKPKKKKIRHVQIKYSIPEELVEKLNQSETIRDEDIRRALKRLAQ